VAIDTTRPVEPIRIALQRAAGSPSLILAFPTEG
jgi:hypothetical protein